MGGPRWAVAQEDFGAFALGRGVFDDSGLEAYVFEQSKPGRAREDAHDLAVYDRAEFISLFQGQDELVVDPGVVRIGVPGP